MRELPGLIRFRLEGDPCYDGNSVINVERGDTTDHIWVAIDIGTTTVVCYLIDLKPTPGGYSGTQRPKALGDVLPEFNMLWKMKTGLPD